MTCGEAGDNSCAEALERMVFFIDRELPGADEATIRAHLEACAPCVDEFDLERAVKALVARSCGETAPEELRRRVLVEIRQFQVRYTEG